MTEDWGVPDWRDASAYPAPDELSLTRWWWEFTRRRPDYREAWETAPGRSSEGERMIERPHELYLRFGMRVLIDPRQRYENDLTLPARRLGTNFSTQPASRIRTDILEQAKWAVEYGGATALTAMIEHERGVADEAEEYGLVLYQFDLSKPLPEQLRQADGLFRARQEYQLDQTLNTPKRQKAKWPLYLRALDADDAEASLRDMAATFWPKLEPNPQKARDTRDNARQLRDNFPI